jgi:alcohol dehydrogenase class IV
VKSFGIPADLAALGVTDDHVGQLAEMAAVDPSVGSNPVPLTVEHLTTLFDSAIHGRLDV